MLGAILASSYPLLDLFWTILFFFVWIIWIFILIRIIFDIFRSHDLGGFAKAIWLIFILFLPFLGVIVYLIARGEKMHERDAQQAQAQDAAFRNYVQQAAGGGQSTAEQLASLADLHTRGVLTDDEFAAEKAKLLTT